MLTIPILPWDARGSQTEIYLSLHTRIYTFSSKTGLESKRDSCLHFRWSASYRVCMSIGAIGIFERLSSSALRGINRVAGISVYFYALAVAPDFP